MSNHDIETQLATYRQACRKGTDWLLGFMNPDGSIGPVQERLFYYRVPWTFALMGEITAASRLLDWISRHMLTPAGAFEGLSPQGIFAQRCGSYPLACLLYGATMLQRFDIVYRGTRHLLTWQDPATGGLRNNCKDMTPTSEQELFPACQAGMTFILTGQIPAATKAGTWVRRLWAIQPDVEHMLYSVCTPAKGLVTHFAADQQAVYVTRKDQPWQHHYNGGIAAAFLTGLHMATGAQQWLDLARRYQEFSMTTDECQFQSMQTCKSGWGSGLLYMVTREQKYRDWTLDWEIGLWSIRPRTASGRTPATGHPTQPTTPTSRSPPSSSCTWPT
jgi:hypothetical protein